MHKSLEAAERALAAGGWSEALVPLLAAFGERRAPELAELIEEVSELARQRLPELAPDKREAMQKEWLALEARRRPEDVPRLLRALTRTHWRSTDALARARRFARRPPDPRVPALLVDQLLHPPFTAGSSRPFWQQVLELVERHADPRTADLLRGCMGRLPRVLVRREQRQMRTWLLGRAAETLEAVERALTPPPVLPAAAAERVARCRVIVEKRRRVGAELLEAVLADPGDDGTRAVLADHLQEAGDPRGELIALQLAHAAGGGDPASLERERQLIRRHRAESLGPLREVLEPERCVLERGFLSQAWLRRGVPAEAVQEVVGSPWWSTVRAIHGPWSELEPLVRHPVMRGLQHLSTTNEVFGARRLAITSLTVPGPDFDLTSSRRAPRRYLAVLEPRDVARMASARTFRGLEHLGLGMPLEEPEGHLAFLRQIGWVKRLRRITLFADALSHAPLETWALALAWIPGLRTICVERSAREWALVLSGGGRGRWTALDLLTTPSWLGNLWPAVEAAVGLGARRVTLRIAPAPRPAHQKRVDRLLAGAPGLGVTLKGPPPCMVRLEGTPSVGDGWRWLPQS